MRGGRRENSNHIKQECIFAFQIPTVQQHSVDKRFLTSTFFTIKLFLCGREETMNGNHLAKFFLWVLLLTAKCFIFEYDRHY